MEIPAIMSDAHAQETLSTEQPEKRSHDALMSGNDMVGAAATAEDRTTKRVKVEGGSDQQASEINAQPPQPRTSGIAPIKEE
jgi:hypothetical protein